MTEPRPIAIASPRVERRLHATRWAASTGSAINAAISRMPTTRIEIPIVSAASTATIVLRRPTRTPATRVPSSSSTAPTSPR